tara:strand:+ start:15473 stop:16927 length:1455 start_codon:yes stop_codon:yes gene_type:complete
LDQKIWQDINFGTDGWRGIIGIDFNLQNLSKVVAAACQELNYQYFDFVKTKKILIGYDRRFMASEYADEIIPVVLGSGFEPVKTSTYVTTPSCSLYAREFNFLGALIITASHNPYNWLGLKIKSFQGCSVDESFTIKVQQRIKLGNKVKTLQGHYEKVNVKEFHLEKIKSQFNIQFILDKLNAMNIKVFIDSMHGSSAKSIQKLFNNRENNIVQGIRENRDPYFGGNPPEPLFKYLDYLIQVLKENSKDGNKTLGIIFDGDGDRIAVIDELGRYCSTQLLLPYFINYLGNKNNNYFPVLKTVSGSDIIKKISEQQNREVFELPVGFKYIAEKMIKENIFIGGEESGGVGFGSYLPERDALYAAMILLNGIADQSKYLYQSLDEIDEKYGPSVYDRVDMKFTNELEKSNLRKYITENIPKKICGKEVINISTIDGIKLRISDNYWILFRFSGTEPLLRLYCEAPTEKLLDKTLLWCKDFIKNKVI